MTHHFQNYWLTSAWICIGLCCKWWKPSICVKFAFQINSKACYINNNEWNCSDRHYQLGLLPCKESQEQEKYEKEIKERVIKSITIIKSMKLHGNVKKTWIMLCDCMCFVFAVLFSGWGQSVVLKILRHVI